MLNRRAWFRSAAGSGAALALAPRLLQALEPLLAPLQGTLLKKAIPATGEMLPVIGLGSSATFASVARSEEVRALKEVFRAMVDRGATLFDTAPSYGASEQVAGQIVNELGIADKMFWATKLNAAGRGAGATTDPAAARPKQERTEREAGEGSEETREDEAKEGRSEGRRGEGRRAPGSARLVHHAQTQLVGGFYKVKILFVRHGFWLFAIHHRAVDIILIASQVQADPIGTCRQDEVLQRPIDLGALISSGRRWEKDHPLHKLIQRSQGRCGRKRGCRRWCCGWRWSAGGSAAGRVG